MATTEALRNALPRRFVRIRRRWMLILAALILAGAGVGAWVVLGGSNAPRYSTVQAQYGSVQRTVDATGTVGPVTELSLDFPTSGRVRAVLVKPGQRVRAGATLAVLDPSTLAGQVRQAQSALALARATLALDLAPQTQQSVAAAGGSVATSRASLAQARSSLSDLRAADAQAVAAARQTLAQALAGADQQGLADLQTVRAGEQKLMLDQAAIRSAEIALLQAQQQAQQSETQAQAQVTSAQSAVNLAPTAQEANSAQVALVQAQQALLDTRAANALSVDAAGAALAQVQATLAADTAQLASDREKLAKDRAAAVASARQALAAARLKMRQDLGQASGQVRSALVGLQNAQAALGAAQVPTPAAQLASDRAAIASAQAQLKAARLALGQARLRAPITGVVASVNLVRGQIVGGAGISPAAAASSSSGGSSVPPIVLVNPSALQVVATVTDAQVRQVKPGQVVQIAPAGGAAAVTGTVMSVSTLSSVTQNVPTYSVMIALTGRPATIRLGSSVQVSIIVQQAANVLTVPTGALRGEGTQRSVLVLAQGKTREQPVQVGLSDPLRTEIRSGLNAGTPVVVATLTGTTQQQNQNGEPGEIGGGEGGFGGGGLGHAGGGGAGDAGGG